jgi:hypothetical protein
MVLGDGFYTTSLSLLFYQLNYSPIVAGLVGIEPTTE